MNYTEVMSIVDKIPEILAAVDIEENEKECLTLLNTYGVIIKKFKNEHFYDISVQEQINFTNKTKQIRKLFDNVIEEKRAEMEKISLHIRKLNSLEKVNNYRSSI